MSLSAIPQVWAWHSLGFRVRALSLLLDPQECAPGHYRDSKGPFLGRCVPCQCHSHSDRCLPGSGICVVSRVWVAGMRRGEEGCSEVSEEGEVGEVG